MLHCVPSMGSAGVSGHKGITITSITLRYFQCFNSLVMKSWWPRKIINSLVPSNAITLTNVNWWHHTITDTSFNWWPHVFTWTIVDLLSVTGVYTEFSGRLSEEPFPRLIQKLPCILIFKTGQPGCQLNLTEGQIRLDLTSGRPLV